MHDHVLAVAAGSRLVYGGATSEHGRRFDTMDVRRVFRSISERMISQFDESSEVRHAGGRGSLREDQFATFLKTYLPARYAVGRGEIVTPSNYTSGQIDVVIHDPLHCPVLIPSESHAVYPVESVFGAISVKSRLSATELKEAYTNIVEFKRIVPKQPFTYALPPGVVTGVMVAPVPVTGIFAYALDRSLDALRQQVERLDADLPEPWMRPDFVAVLGVGIIGPAARLRGAFNNYNLPSEAGKLAYLSKTGRHTLLRLYMRILDECNTITLRPLELMEYERMPRLVGQHRIRYHDRFVPRDAGDPNVGKVLSLNVNAVNEIIAKSKPVTRRQHFLNWLGVVPVGLEKVNDLDEVIFEYNPKDLAPLDPASIVRDHTGGYQYQIEGFFPVQIEIDGNVFAVDIASLPQDKFDVSADYTVDELFST